MDIFNWIQVGIVIIFACIFFKCGFMFGVEKTLEKLISEKYIRHETTEDGEIVFYTFDE